MDILNRKLGKKSGFTLVEMLIVVAIIAILIAIAIPIISATLEKAREAVDDGNWRSAISLGNAYYLTADREVRTWIAENGLWLPFKINDQKEGFIDDSGLTKDSSTGKVTANGTDWSKVDKYGEGTNIGAVKADLTDCFLAIHIQNPPEGADADFPIVVAVWVNKAPGSSLTSDDGIVWNPAANKGVGAKGTAAPHS